LNSEPSLRSYPTITQPRAALAAFAAEVTEVEVVVLVPEQRERVVDRHSPQLGIDLVALDLRIVELVEDPATLVRLLRVTLVELVVVLHRLLGDPVQLHLEGWELTRLQLIPWHEASPPFLDFSLASRVPPRQARKRCDVPLR
jgi:hypothetical protein